MRFRLGAVIGFGLGYYLGAKAGRERYAQLNRLIKKARRSDAFEAATSKAKDVVDLTVDAAKEFVDEHKPGGSTSHDGALADATSSGSI